MEPTYLEANRARWDESAEPHRVAYAAEALAADPEALSDVVREDARLLAPYLPGHTAAGLDLIHLQCHIGTDTLSWARLGARVTGLDMSAGSLTVARDLARRSGADIEYVQSTIDDAAHTLAGRQYDVVYTSIGVLCWLDDLNQWARLIAGLLRPDGVFFIREGHPVAVSLDYEAPEGEFRLTWPYFNTGAVAEDAETDYMDVPLANRQSYEWAHGLGEIIGALLRAGLTIVDFEEYDTLPWTPLNWMVRDGDSYALPEPYRNRCPLAFSIVARREKGAQ